MLNISNINIILIKDQPLSKVKAYASVVLAEAFTITNIKIIEGKKGMFITMPSTKDRNGNRKDVAYPIDSKVHRELSNRILGAYYEAVAANDKNNNLDEDKSE